MDITKLPKWAQEKIKDLSNNVRNLEASLAEHNNQTPTRIKWGYNFEGNAYGYINEHETIHFMFGSKAIRARITSDNRLLINADRSIRIKPEGSNSITVEMED